MPQTKAVPRPDLGVLAYEYAINAASLGFIAPLVLPWFFTKLKTAQYPYIPAAALLEMVDTLRAPRAAYARGDWEFDWLDYNCTENGFEEPIDDTESKQFRSYFDAEVVATQRAMYMVLRSMEKRCVGKVFNETTFTPHDVAHAWNSYADADPLADVNAGRRAMRMTTGLEPNALILDKDILRHVSMCEAVMDRVKYSAPGAIRGSLTLDQLKAYFEVEYIFAAGAVYNKAAKKKAVSVDTIWSPTYAMLARVSDGGQDLKQPSLGRTFLWEEDSPEEVVVESYREEQTRSDIVRARQQTDECIQFSAAGYLLKGVVV